MGLLGRFGLSVFRVSGLSFYSAALEAGTRRRKPSHPERGLQI